MQGLRTSESEKFIKFFTIVQEEAGRKGKVFFLDAGEGRDLINDEIEGEDLSGWLIPKDKAGIFEKDFAGFKNLEKWSDFIFFARWKQEQESIKISFVI